MKKDFEPVEKVNAGGPLVPEGNYRAIIRAVTPLGKVDQEEQWRLTFEVMSEPPRTLVKDFNARELRQLGADLGVFPRFE